MPLVKVYTTSYCPFCTAAKNFLKAKGIDFEEISVTNKPEIKQWLVKETGQKTVPQIFIDNRSIGGFTELSELDSKGELDHLKEKL